MSITLQRFCMSLGSGRVTHLNSAVEENSSRYKAHRRRWICFHRRSATTSD